MKNQLGIIVAAIALVAVGVSAVAISKLKAENAKMTDHILNLKADLEAAEITARNASKQKVVEQVVTVADPNAGKDAAELARLQALVAEQQKQLAALKAEPTAEGAAEPEAKKPPEPFPAERTAESMKSFFDRMKEEDPERYQQMKERMAGMKDRVTGGMADRINFLTQVDVSGLNDEEMEVVAVTVEKMNTIQQLMSSIDTEADDINSFEVRSQMFSQMGELRDLMHQSRDILQTDMIRSLGYNEAESRELGEYLGSIQEMTSMRSIFRGPGMGRGMGGGPPPPAAGGGDK